MKTSQPRPPAPPPADCDLLKLEEAGYLLGRISARSVRRLIESGQLAACRITTGGSIRIRRAEIDRFIRSSEFQVRPDDQEVEEKATQARKSKETLKARVKADWNTGEDPFEKGGRS